MKISESPRREGRELFAESGMKIKRDGVLTDIFA